MALTCVVRTNERNRSDKFWTTLGLKYYDISIPLDSTGKVEIPTTLLEQLRQEEGFFNDLEEALIEIPSEYELTMFTVWGCDYRSKKVERFHMTAAAVAVKLPKLIKGAMRGVTTLATQIEWHLRRPGSTTDLLHGLVDVV